MGEEAEPWYGHICCTWAPWNDTCPGCNPPPTPVEQMDTYQLRARIDVLSGLLRGMARRAVQRGRMLEDTCRQEYAQRLRAKDAEAELLRVRPVVDAAEALVEHWAVCEEGGYIDAGPEMTLLDTLSAAVKEAQR